MIKVSERGLAASDNGNDVGRNDADYRKVTPVERLLVQVESILQEYTDLLVNQYVSAMFFKIGGKKYGYLGDVLILDGALFFSRIFPSHRRDILPESHFLAHPYL